MLMPALRTFLRPHVHSLGVVVLLQLVQTFATLTLPTLNAGLVDHGVLTGDTRHVLRLGAAMAAVTLVQVLCAATAVRFAARTAMALGRDLRCAVFERVLDFSAREMNRFGAPSLLTRTTTSSRSSSSC